MIEGYKFIYLDSPQHEPQIAGTRLTVAHIVLDTKYGANLKGLETVIEDYQGRLTYEMIEDALKYYREHKTEIDTYIAEAKARKGMIIKDGKVIRQPDE